MPIKIEFNEMNIFSQIRMILLKYENETTCDLPTSSALLGGPAPYTVRYGSFLHECAKIFGYISAQINIYIHSVRGRHLRIVLLVSLVALQCLKFELCGRREF